MAAVLIHVLGDAVNSKLYISIHEIILILDSRCGGDNGGSPNLANTSSCAFLRRPGCLASYQHHHLCWRGSLECVSPSLFRFVPLLSSLALKSGRILFEASPIHLDLNHITEDLLAVSSPVSLFTRVLSNETILRSCTVSYRYMTSTFGNFPIKP